MKTNQGIECLPCFSLFCISLSIQWANFLVVQLITSNFQWQLLPPVADGSVAAASYYGWLGSHPTIKSLSFFLFPDNAFSVFQRVRDILANPTSDANCIASLPDHLCLNDLLSHWAQTQKFCHIHGLQWVIIVKVYCLTMMSTRTHLDS